MAFIENKHPQIGDLVITQKVHSCLVGKFEKGSTVKITDIDSIRGYTIEDNDGHKMCEIGWII